jgi:tetratricopeptide (TPR) repeat protein
MPSDTPEQLAREGRFADAVAAFERQAATGGGVDALLQAANAAADGQLWRDAERLLKDVLIRDPARVDAYVNLGMVYESTDRLEEARDALERALEIEERQPVLTLLGSIQRRLGDISAQW